MVLLTSPAVHVSLLFCVNPIHQSRTVSLLRLTFLLSLTEHCWASQQCHQPDDRPSIPTDLPRKPPMSRTPIRGLVTVLAGTIILVATFPLRAAVPEKPSVLFIVADDMGWKDIGFHGAEILTPNLDRLAASGVRLEQNYVMATCSPTRAGLLSGRFPSRFGLVSPTNRRVFPFGMTTLASALKSRGYLTGITGKWHLGSMPEWGPRKFGFDRSYGSLAGGVNQYTHFYKDGPYRRTWHRNDQYCEEEGHSTDLFAREAIRWIDAAGDRPFFILVAFTAVHYPLQEPDRWTGLYDGKIEYPSRKLFAACATHMDDTVGRMVEALERTGRRQKTLIVFTSDNGGQRSWTTTSQYGGGHTPCPVLGNNGPLRGWKGQLYEGGIRVPAFAQWPGVLKPGRLDTPVHVVDWFPTLARLAGFEVDDSLKLDGRDIWPLLANPQQSSAARTLYWKTRGVSALRHGDWKMLAYPKRTELYNLAEDPYEKQNVVGRHPERVAELQALLAEQQKLDENKSD